MERKANTESTRGRTAAAILFVPLLLAACAEVSPADYRGLPPAPPPPTYFTVMVRPGDTLGSIGARYDVSVSSIERLNGIERSRDAAPGEELRIPATGRHTREAVFRDAMSGPNRQTHPVATVTYASLPPPRATKIARNDAPAPVPHNPPSVVVHADQQIPVSDGNARFIWPLTGPIVSSFGSSGGGTRNDGINIAAKLGEPIHAAAGGTVSYAGNELKGYGNLILIRHDDGYVTAYAHAQSISVNRGDRVEKGQVIGLAGATGDVGSPQLHFEIRRGVEPVDPRPLLVADRSS